MPVASVVGFPIVIVVVTGLIVMWVSEAGRWVAFDGAPGHRPGKLFAVRELLRRAGVRHRVSNVVSLGSQATIGAGMSTTVLVHRDDLMLAKRVVAEHRATLFPKDHGGSDED